MPDQLRQHDHPHHQGEQTLVYEIGTNLLHALRDQPVALANRILAELQSLSERIDQMNQTIADLQAQVASDNAAIKSNLDNVSADIVGLDQKIADLTAQLAAGQTLTQEDIDALAAIKDESAALVTSTASLAATVPDIPPVAPPVDPVTGLPLAQRRR